MATKNQQPSSEPREPRRMKQCQCGATVFLGPVSRGPIINGVMDVKETLYECANCKTVKPLSEIGERDMIVVPPL